MGGVFPQGLFRGGDLRQGCHRMIPPQGFDEGAIPSQGPRGPGRGETFPFECHRGILFQGLHVLGGGGGKLKGLRFSPQ